MFWCSLNCPFIHFNAPVTENFISLYNIKKIHGIKNIIFVTADDSFPSSITRISPPPPPLTHLPRTVHSHRDNCISRNIFSTVSSHFRNFSSARLHPTQRTTYLHQRYGRRRRLASLFAFLSPSFGSHRIRCIFVAQFS